MAHPASVDALYDCTHIKSNFQHADDCKVRAALEAGVRANCKDRFGAAVGYVTADLTSMKLSKSVMERRRSVGRD